jgi:hypothetical protein
MFGERKNLTGESLPVGKAMEPTKSSMVQREHVISVYVMSIEHSTVWGRVAHAMLRPR